MKTASFNTTSKEHWNIHLDQLDVILDLFHWIPVDVVANIDLVHGDDLCSNNWKTKTGEDKRSSKRVITFTARLADVNIEATGKSKAIGMVFKLEKLLIYWRYI